MSSGDNENIHTASSASVAHVSPPPILQHVPFPDKLELKEDSGKASTWENFRQVWDNYEISSQLIDHPKQRRTATLLTCFSPSGLKVFNSLSFDQPADKQDIDIVLEKMTAFCRGVVNETYERYRFNTRIQAANESIDHFYSALLLLSKDCAFGDLTNSLIRDRIVVGVSDSATQKRLLYEKKLTLEKCLEIARSFEATNARLKSMKSKGETEPEYERDVDQVQMAASAKSWKPKSRQTLPKSWPREAREPTKRCYYCGYAYHNRQVCPARNSSCMRCGKQGHFKSVCKSSKAVNEVFLDEQEVDENVFLGAVHGNSAKANWHVTLVVESASVHFRIDTGADVDIISKELYLKNFAHKVIFPSKKILRGPDTKPLPVLGYIQCQISKGDKYVQSDIYIIEGATALLGRDSSVALDIVALVNGIESYPQLFQGLGTMPISYTINLEPNATPYAVVNPRRVAVPLMPKVKNELDRLETLGVITRVTQPTEWCAPIVVVPKDNGHIRICVDFTKLNQAVNRERHILPSVDHVLAQMAGAIVFSKLDANSGFHQIKLAEESQLLTTFITPFGRYCYQRLPFGINSGPEHYQMQIHNVLENLPGVACVMDDIVIFGATIEEHDARLDMALSRLSKAGVTLNKSKCEFKKPQISFLGQIVGQDGIQPDPAKVTAITNLPEPQNITELRRFLGMVNQLGKFLPHLATVTEPLRALLSSKSEWLWSPVQASAFQQIKDMLSTEPVLALYDPTRPTKVTADSSSYGLGAVLTQKCPDGVWRPIVYASRSLTATERRYAQIEKEGLAATWACCRFQDYLSGIKFTLETDHKPLVPLLGSKSLDELSPRIQRLRMRLMRFTYSIEHVPGKLLFTADTLSRAPASSATAEDEELTSEISAFVNHVMHGLPATDARLEQIRRHQQEDNVCIQILHYVKDGWPDKGKLQGILQHYWPYQAELTEQIGLLMYGTRLVIPSSLRQDMLDKLHEGHQGIHKCRQRALQSIWWPGVSKQIKELVDQCKICCQTRRNHPEPLLPSELPQRPWQKVGADLMQFKSSQYLVLVDYYSRYIELSRLENTTSRTVINHTKSIFARHGVPETVVSDNGPQFSASEYAEFASEYGFTHVTSSPGHPSANGEAERAVRTVKELLYAAKDPYAALLCYRSTPLACGYSPAELLMSRRLRTKLPVVPECLHATVPDSSVVNKQENHSRLKQKLVFDSRHAAKPLPLLDPGAEVWIRDRKEPGVVQGQHSTRSYIVQTPCGTYRRNRIQLNNLPATHANIPPQADPQPESPGTGPQHEATPPTEMPPQATAVPPPLHSPCGKNLVTTRSGRVVKKPSRFQNTGT